MDRRGASFLRASHLVCYWDVDAFVIYNYASRIGVKASPVVAQVLDTCGRWRSFEQIEKCLPGYDPGSLRAVLDQMVDRSLLRRSDTGRAGVERNAGWSSWHPAAGFFHFSTKNVRFPRSPKEAARVWRLRGPSSPPPPPTKSYPRA